MLAQDMSDVRLRLQYYINSNVLPEGEARKKLVDILLASKISKPVEASPRERRKKTIADVTKEAKDAGGEKEESPEGEEEEKTVSNVGRTLKLIYETMTRQPVSNSGLTRC